MQTMVRKCTNNGSGCAVYKRAVSGLSVLCQCALTATETLRVGRICANSGGGMQRQRSKNAQTTMISCSEMRTEGT